MTHVYLCLLPRHLTFFTPPIVKLSRTSRTNRNPFYETNCIMLEVHGSSWLRRRDSQCSEVIVQVCLDWTSSCSPTSGPNQQSWSLKHWQWPTGTEHSGLPSGLQGWTPCGLSWSWAAASAPRRRICVSWGRTFPGRAHWTEPGPGGRAHSSGAPGWTLGRWGWGCPGMRAVLLERETEK